MNKIELNICDYAYYLVLAIIEVPPQVIWQLLQADHSVHFEQGMYEPHGAVSLSGPRQPPVCEQVLVRVWVPTEVKDYETEDLHTSLFDGW